MKTYTLGDVATLIDTHPARLRHWSRLRLLLTAKGQGTGRHRRFTFPDLIEAQIAVILDGLGLMADAIEVALVHWRLITTAGAYRLPRRTINKRGVLAHMRAFPRFFLELEDAYRHRRPSDSDAARHEAAYYANVRKVLDPATRGAAAYQLNIIPPADVVGEPFPDLDNVEHDGDQQLAAAAYFALPCVRACVIEPRTITTPLPLDEMRSAVRSDVVTTIGPPLIPSLGSIQIDLRAVFEKLEAATGDRWPVDADAPAAAQPQQVPTPV